VRYSSHFGIGTSFCWQARHFSTPRMLQIMQMNVPQTTHG
jgi:hypothetical protein